MKIYIERKIESEKDLPHCLRGVKHYAHQRIGNIIYTDLAWTWRVNDIDWYLEPIEVGEGVEEILIKKLFKDSTVTSLKDINFEYKVNPASYILILEAMKEYAAIQVVKALDKLTDEEIEEWANADKKELIDYELQTISELVQILLGRIEGAKAALNGEIKKKVK